VVEGLPHKQNRIPEDQAMSHPFLIPLAALGIALAAHEGVASTVYGIDFPGGASSFADEVVWFAPGFGYGGSEAPCTDATMALGVAYATPGVCTGYVSIGEGGSLVVAFTDNYLTTSGDASPDLQIFAGGDHDEHFVVEIGRVGHPAERIKLTVDGSDILLGGSIGIDIDAVAGVIPGALYSYVHIWDVPRYCDPATGRMLWSVGEACGTNPYNPFTLPTDGPWAGADIYGVGAITSVIAATPLPAGLMLMGTALGALAALRRRRRA